MKRETRADPTEWMPTSGWATATGCKLTLCQSYDIQLREVVASWWANVPYNMLPSIPLPITSPCLTDTRNCILIADPCRVWNRWCCRCSWRCMQQKLLHKPRDNTALFWVENWMKGDCKWEPWRHSLPFRTTFPWAKNKLSNYFSLDLKYI